METTTLLATRPRLRLVPLHVEDGLRSDIVGAKAAALALADRHGLPAVDGFVIPVASCEQIAAGIDPAMHDVLHNAWLEASERGSLTLIVRSSSPVEDGTSSSMAGMFLSVPTWTRSPSSSPPSRTSSPRPLHGTLRWPCSCSAS